MEIIGKFKILGSFRVTGRGLVARGDILEGIVKVGASVTINIGTEDILLKIKSVEMIDNVSTNEYWVGLLFDCYNEKEKLENIKLQAQIVEIFYNN